MVHVIQRCDVDGHDTEGAAARMMGHRCIRPWPRSTRNRIGCSCARLKLGLYAAPAVLVVNALASNPKANADCGGSENSGGNCDDNHGSIVSGVARNTPLWVMS